MRKSFMKTFLLSLKMLMLVVALSVPVLMPDTANAWSPGQPIPTADEDQGGRTALVLFDYSLGLNNDNNCLSCTFIQQFIVALASFSAAVFMYFRAFFIALLPILMATWIAWTAGRLMVTGGADGREFIMNIVKKATLFFFLWTVMVNDIAPSTDPTESMTVTDAHAPWSWFGPIALEKGFMLGNEVRRSTANSLTLDGSLSTGGTDIADQIDFGCDGIGEKNPQLAADPDAYAFAWEASEVACAAERVHMVGIASGLAMIEGSWAQLSGFSIRRIGEFFVSLFNALIITVIGLAMILVFALSAIWFIFLVLDIVVKVLIIAAVAPLLMFFALLQPTRQYAWSAVRGSIGALTTALGLAIVATLAFYLIVNLVNVYNTAAQIYDPGLVDIGASSPIGGLREFIYRMQINDTSDENLIPMNLTTPWFHYLILVSLAIFALGKKIISMIENIIGAKAMSEMADQAKKLAVLGGAMGIGGAFAGIQVGRAAAGATLAGGATVIGGGHMAGRALADRARGKRGEDKLGQSGWSSWLFERGNPFGAAARDAKTRQMSRTGGRGGIRQGMDLKDQVTRNADELTND